MSAPAANRAATILRSSYLGSVDAQRTEAHHHDYAGFVSFDKALARAARRLNVGAVGIFCPRMPPAHHQNGLVGISLKAE